MSIKITCKDKGGFRRCGVRHPQGTAEYPDGTFTAKQIAEMQAEKHLLVEVGGGDPYEAMTKAEILEKIEKYQIINGPIDDLKKEKANKATLIESLKKHEAQAKANAEQKGRSEE